MILSGSQSLCFGLSYILAGPCQQVGWLPWQVWRCSQGVLARLGLHDGDGTPPRSWPNSFRPKKCMLARLEPSRIFPNTSSNKQSKRSCFRVVLYYCNREIFPGSESPEISVARTRMDRCSNLPPWGKQQASSVVTSRKTMAPATKKLSSVSYHRFVETLALSKLWNRKLSISSFFVQQLSLKFLLFSSN